VPRGVLKGLNRHVTKALARDESHAHGSASDRPAIPFKCVRESLFEDKVSKPNTKAGEREVVLNEAQIAELKTYKQNHYPMQSQMAGYFPVSGSAHLMRVGL